jgi:hypothetical protein
MDDWENLLDFAKQNGYTISKTPINNSNDFMYHWVKNDNPIVSGTVNNPNKIISNIYEYTINNMQNKMSINNNPNGKF